MSPANSTPEVRELGRIAAARLNPSLTDPNYLVLRSRKAIFHNWIENLPNQKLKILDIGGRYQPYRPLLEGRIGPYFALDILQTKLVDVVGSGESIPFAANSFDLTIATQVFDCFENPQAAAREIHRTLKPGGILLMSVAACAPRFADEERWRFTASGIRSLLATFNRIEIAPEVTSLGGLVRTANLGLHSFTHFPPVRKCYELTLCPALNLAGLMLERMQLTKNDQFTSNYSVLAQK